MPKPNYTIEEQARKQVAWAIRNGKLHRPWKCSKCHRIRKTQAHHTDYSKPLEVVWLCVSCHQKIPKRPKGYRWSEVDLDIWRNERARRQQARA